MGERNDIKGKVCVTGASGFVASWLVKLLLELGYYVKGTVRDPGNYKKLEHLWQLEGAKERLQLVKADLMEEGSFDGAVMGCEGVFHTASPVVKANSDPKTEILDPAVIGTLNVLQSCKKNPEIRRVVLTSSSSTIRAREDIDPTLLLDESSWSSVELCERLKLWYVMAKVSAEKAAWEFAKENNIDLVTVLPSFVIGPSLPRDLCLTASDVLGLLKGNSERFSWHGRMGYVHIDDVARCHVLVYEDVTAHGRYLCSSDVLDNDELAALLAKRYPSMNIPKRRYVQHIVWCPIPGVGFPQPAWRRVSISGTSVSMLSYEFHNYYVTETPRYNFNTSKLAKMGFKFKGIEEMFDDCIQSLKGHGYFP